MNGVAHVDGFINYRFAFDFQLFAIVLQAGETARAVCVAVHEQLVVERHRQTGSPDDLGVGQLDGPEVLDQRVLELDRRPFVEQPDQFGGRARFGWGAV